MDYVERRISLASCSRETECLPLAFSTMTRGDLGCLDNHIDDDLLVRLSDRAGNGFQRFELVKPMSACPPLCGQDHPPSTIPRVRAFVVSLARAQALLNSTSRMWTPRTPYLDQPDSSVGLFGPVKVWLVHFSGLSMAGADTRCPMGYVL